MRATITVAVALVLGAVPARADDNVGVVVTGDPKLAGDVAAHLEGWLKHHGHAVAQSPLPPDAINAVVNCLVIDDQSCARKVVEARARPDGVVLARVDVADHNITFNVYWFVKGHEPIAERRACEQCTEDSWHGITDGMLTALAGASQVRTGHLKLSSKPAGMIVMLDGQQIGVTPLERDIASGPHRLELTHGGRTVASRQVEIRQGELARVSMRADERLADSDEESGSRLGPALLLGAGIVALGTGGVFLAYGHKGGQNDKYVYPNATPIGIGVLAVGIGATIGGAILFEQAGHTGSAPVAAVGPGGAYVGWATQF